MTTWPHLPKTFSARIKDALTRSLAAVLFVAIVAGIGTHAAALPPSVEINPDVVVIQPFNFSFTLSDPDGIADLDPASLVYDINGLDIGRLIVADILDSAGSSDPDLRIEALDANSVRVTFSNVTLSPLSSTNIFISIRDNAGEVASAEVSLLAPPEPPFVATTIENVAVQESVVQNVTLQRGVELVGLVTTASGIPVPNVRLRLERQDEND